MLLVSGRHMLNSLQICIFLQKRAYEMVTYLLGLFPFIVTLIMWPEKLQFLQNADTWGSPNPAVKWHHLVKIVWRAFYVTSVVLKSAQ